ncbi:MAG: hypothetical protein Q9183_006599 [Haloplaca sp. 2 TL-2023]
MWYDAWYILFNWKLGWWEIGAKIFVFQEIYETLLYLLAPFVIPISFATRPVFCAYLYAATIVLYTVPISRHFAPPADFLLESLLLRCSRTNQTHHQIHLRTRNETVNFKAFCYYVPFKWVLGFVNIASCYYAIYTYATYFAKRHPKIIEDDKAVEIVLRLEQNDTFVSEKGEMEDLNELMYKIAKPVGKEGGTGGEGKGGRGKRRSVIPVRTRASWMIG